jgi:isocitrate dehydrogenase
MFDNTPDVVRTAENLERVCVDTVQSGDVTRDLAILIRADHP